MTKEQTKNLFRRIKSHYQEFSVDEFKLDEWYKELKDYDYEDVTSRFELHLNSESYGDMIPKLWFLKKGLTTIAEKKESKIFKNHIICQICNKEVDIRLYESHYSKCLSIDFIQRECERIYHKQVNREDLEKMDNIRFTNAYMTFLNVIKKNPHYSNQEKIIDKILGKDNELTVGEAVRGLGV